jgi:hypothetical protein
MPSHVAICPRGSHLEPVARSSEESKRVLGEGGAYSKGFKSQGNNSRALNQEGESLLNTGLCVPERDAHPGSCLRRKPEVYISQANTNSIWRVNCLGFSP